MCDATWGDVWAEVEGERLFFCCDVCVVQYQGLVHRLKEATGWTLLESIEMGGDRRGRTSTVTSNGRSASFEFAFDAEGKLLRFRPAPAA